MISLRDRPWSSRLRSVGTVFLLAVFFSLVAGVAHVVIVLVRRDVFGAFTWTGRDMIWMSPVADVLFALPLALVVAPLALLLSERLTLRLSAFLFSAFGAFTVLALFPQLEQYVKLILAAGVGVEMTRQVLSASEKWLRRGRRLTVGLAGGVAIAGASFTAARLVGEQRSMASLATPPGGAPNVLILVWDTVRASALSLYGYARETTPELDRLARDAAVFEWAIAPAPWTLPSHASLFTGRNASELSSRLLQPLDDEHPLLTEAFRERGYATGGFVANYNYTSHESGLARGFIRYEDYLVSRKQILLSAALSQTESFRMFYRELRRGSIRGAMRGLAAFRWFKRARYNDVDRKTAPMINEEFLRWHASLDGRPFFAFLNYFDAHRPYEPPEAFTSRFARPASARDRYDGGIAFLDHHFAKLLTELDRRGQLNNTIVVVTSDHGEQFGEHGKFAHANSLHMPLLRVPLVIRFPAGVAGARISDVTSLRDLGATVLELAGLPPHEISGTSFARLLSGRPPSPASPVISELEQHVGSREERVIPEMKAILDDSLHYIRELDHSEMLFAYRRDTVAASNLATLPAWQPALRQMRSRLEHMAPMPKHVAAGRVVR